MMGRWFRRPPTNPPASSIPQEGFPALLISPEARQHVSGFEVREVAVRGTGGVFRRGACRA